MNDLGATCGGRECAGRGVYAARKSIYEPRRHGAHGEDFPVGSCFATDSV